MTLALCCLSMRRAAQSCARPSQPISSVHCRADDSSSDDESNSIFSQLPAPWPPVRDFMRPVCRVKCASQ